MKTNLYARLSNFWKLSGESGDDNGNKNVDDSDYNVYAKKDGRKEEEIVYFYPILKNITRGKLLLRNFGLVLGKQGISM